MREVTVYYSYDDEEFFDRDECLRYERQAIEALMSVNDCYDFLTKDGDYYIAPDYQCEDVEGWMDWLSDAAEHCDYVNVRHILPENAVQFIDHEWVIVLLPKISMGKLACLSMMTLRMNGLKWVNNPF